MIALDANGADAGPAAVADGARLSGEQVLVFGPAAELGDGIEVVDSPLGVGGDEEPVRAVRSNPDVSIVQAAKALALGGGVPVIHLVRTAYDTDDQAVEVCDTLMAANSFILSYQLPAD